MALLDINLLSQQQTRIGHLNQANVVVGLVVGAILGLELLVGVFFISTAAVRNSEKKDLQNRTVEAQKEIDNLNKTKVDAYDGMTLSEAAKAYQSQVDGAKSLIDNHKYYTLYLSEIALNTPKTIAYTGFNSTGTNQISITGVANNYTEVSKLAESFKKLSFAKNTAIQDAKQQTGNAGTNGSFVQFTLLIDLKSAKDLNLLPKPNSSGNSQALPVQGANP